MQQQVLDYGRRTPRRRLRLLLAFHATCALASVICAASLIAQGAGWGQPVMVSLDASMRPLETRYGLLWGGYDATFDTMVRVTVAFPIVWLAVIVWRAFSSRPRGGHSAAA